MTTQEAIEFFGGTQIELARVLGCAQSTVAEWGVYPPPLRQLQIEKLSRNRLKAQADVFKRRKKAA